MRDIRSMGVLFGAFIVACVGAYWLIPDGGIPNEVTYHNRHYLFPDTHPNMQRFDSLDGTFVATGEQVDGMNVYDTKSYDKISSVVPTLLFLKDTQGKFIVYSLSGGP